VNDEVDMKLAESYARAAVLSLLLDCAVHRRYEVLPSWIPSRRTHSRAYFGTSMLDAKFWTMVSHATTGGKDRAVLGKVAA
jgi:hypothetical protein